MRAVFFLYYVKQYRKKVQYTACHYEEVEDGVHIADLFAKGKEHSSYGI